MNDISKDKDYQEFFAGIKELAKGLMQIRERAAIEYAPGKSSVSCPLKPSDSAPLKHSTMPP